MAGAAPNASETETAGRDMTPEETAARITDLEGALRAACNYIECAIPNLGRKASSNYASAAASYRKIAAGEMKFSDLAD